MSVPDRASTRSDAMPTTRGTNFSLAEPNLEFVCATVMTAEDLARARPHLVAMGEVAGGELDTLAAMADKHSPTLRTHDATGRRVDEIVRHPAYEAMERIAFERFGLAAMSHREGVLGWPERVSHVMKYALSYLFAQAQFGLLCPVSLTDSTSRMLRRFASDELKARYLPALTSTDFDALWQGAQWMTEKTGGSDVGASSTMARQGADGHWRLTGEKWFCSAANAGAALTLASTGGCAAQQPRPGDVPGAAAAARRNPQRVDHRSAQGQVRLALDADRRGHLSGRDPVSPVCKKVAAATPGAGLRAHRAGM
jgi:alkylation response protein AidB-like acyl-CoA dehydrogenase